MDIIDDNHEKPMEATEQARIVYSATPVQLDMMDKQNKLIARQNKLLWAILGIVIIALILLAFIAWWADVNNIPSQFFQSLAHCREVGAITQ